MECEELVKENKVAVLPLSWRWVVAGLALCGGALLAAAAIDLALPPPLPRSAPPDLFSAMRAYDHLVNLTAVGPRVAGSYENEVVTVGVLVATIKQIAADASPHNRVEIDVQRASGAFSLTFMDGMNNVYRDVQSVVARVSGAGSREHRTAVLLNCHFDTVPDSPGASDDAAGCAVLLETLRALSSSPRPLRHDVVLLFNGAEENILQASHAFITQHKWAKSVRAFINIEACGAGGREVLFQAGPHDPWIVEAYAAVAPHPFASSLAQEMFESGLIPADTDFRIFRDFGNLSGVDLAWSANGYVYHTALDVAARVPPAALQRTGDNVLALLRAVLDSPALSAPVDVGARQPVYFDVLGGAVLAARAPLAAALALATLALVLLKVHLNARDAHRQLYISERAWWGAVCACALCVCGGGVAGVAAAGAVGALLHASGARLAWYARPLLLAPLFGASGALAAGGAARRAWRPPPLLRAWWRARAAHDALALAWGAALAACLARGARSGFLPLLWALVPAAADVLAPRRASPEARACAWALGATLPLLQTSYLLLNSLHMFVPVMGRAGSGPLPPDVTMAVITATLVLGALNWLLPYVMVTRDCHKLKWALCGACAVAVAAACSGALGGAYSAARPQRLMVFHTRRTVHVGDSASSVRTDVHYWVPELDANTRRTLHAHVARGGDVREVGAAQCAAHVYCGAPYFLPVLSLVRRSYALPARSEPLVRLRAAVTSAPLDRDTRALYVNVSSAAAHVVLMVAPPPGAAVAWSSVLAAPLAGAAWGARRVYFVALHAARAPHAWSVALHVRGAGAHAPAHVSLAAHAMSGAHKAAPAHERLARALPPHVAHTGWGVDMHLYTV